MMGREDTKRELAALRYWRRREPGLWGRADRRRAGWLRAQLAEGEGFAAPWQRAVLFATSSLLFVRAAVAGLRGGLHRRLAIDALVALARAVAALAEGRGEET